MMSKHGAIVTNGFLLFPEFSYCRDRLKDEFARRGVEIDSITSTDSLTLIPKQEGPAYDFLIYLDKDPYLACYLEKTGRRLFNKAESIRICDDKGLTHLQLDGVVPMPKTVLAPLNYSNGISLPYLEKVAQELGFPLVAKKSFGSRGMGVRLVESFEGLVALETEWKGLPHLYQRFISASAGKDHRLIVIGGRFLCGYERRAKGDDFRSNLGLGGEGYPCQISQKEIELAETAARRLGLDYCGVDLLFEEDGSPLLCEVNSNAFFEGAENVTGVNVAKAYCEHILISIGA